MFTCHKIAIIAICLLLSFSCTQQKSTLETIQIIGRDLESNHMGLNASRDVLIYLPPSYESGNKRYPVLYLLHGYGENHNAWISSEFTQGFNLQKSMDSLIALGLINEMIVVAPDCSNSLGGSWYTNSIAGGNWEDFLVSAVVRSVDRQYRTIDAPSYRGLAGHSMGGYGTLRLAAKFGDRVFGSVYAMSPVNLSSDNIALEKYPELMQDIKANKSLESMGIFSKLLLSKSIAFLPSDNPPYFCDYLFRLDENGSAILDSAANEKWVSELMVSKIEQSRGNLTGVDLNLEHGLNDPLISQSREYIRKLNENHIENSYTEFEGGHTDKFRERIETCVLPHFSEFFFGSDRLEDFSAKK